MTTPCRRFRFSLRTLFVVVGIVGVSLGWLAWNAELVRQRKALLIRLNSDRAGFTVSGCNVLPGPWLGTRISWFRHALGDQEITTAVLNQDASDDLAQAFAEVFPEATILQGDRVLHAAE